MANVTGLSPKNPRDYVGPNVYLSTIVTRKREPTGADYLQPETGKKYPSGSWWLVGSNPTTGTLGDLWYLAKIVANVAKWIKMSTGTSGPLLGVDVDAHTAPGTDPVVTDVNGIMIYTGAQVAAGTIGTNVIRTDSLEVNSITWEIQRSDKSTTTDLTKNGVSHYDSLPFDIDSNGWVRLKGHGQAFESIDVQAHTAPGTDPVIPVPATGQVTVNGSIVAAHSIPLQTNSLAANAYNVEAQYSSATATSVATNAGMASFNSTSFTVDANGWVKSTSGIAPGFSNLGITYSSPTFTVNGYDATALSASNPAYAWVQSKATPGKLVQLSATENFTFTDGAAGSTVTQRFGLTAAVNWAQDIPFFLYIIAHDTPTSAPAFAISRNPCATTAPAAASIGVSGAVVNVGQSDFFLLTGGTSGIPTVGNYDTNPCLCIGAFRMQFVGATNSWTVQTLSNIDGVGNYLAETRFNLPTGVNGSASGKYFQATGGTQPSFTTPEVKYTVNRNGYIDFAAEFNGCSVAGIGANELQLTLPYIWSADTGSDGFYATYIASGTSTVYLLKATNNGLVYIEDFVAHGALTSSFFINTTIALNDEFSCRVRYKAY